MYNKKSFELLFDLNLVGRKDDVVVAAYQRLRARACKAIDPRKALEVLHVDPILKDRFDATNELINNERQLVGFMKDREMLDGVFIGMLEVDEVITVTSLTMAPIERQFRFCPSPGGRLIEKASDAGQTYPVSYHAEGSITALQLNTDRCDAAFWQRAAARLSLICKNPHLSPKSAKQMKNIHELVKTASIL